MTNFIDSIAVRENLLKVDIVAVDLVSECHIADVQPVTDDINLQYNKLIECYEEIIPLTKLLDDDPMSVVDLLGEFRTRGGILCIRSMSCSCHVIRYWERRIGRWG